MEYNFREIERKWQQQWNESNAYKVDNNSPKPKYYVLDMFPYPSGAGLHVGHPLGYIASDIYSRYKRLKGFNVLHPMGYDAFGLPAEQYAIEHGVHPADSTAQNIANFRRQLDNIGFSYDWSREVKTSAPTYYKWTQWIFLQLFKSWYNRKTDKAESIERLIDLFTTEGNADTPCPGDETVSFTADEWKNFDEKDQQDILMQYRLAYCGEGEVNWCEALGTVLANDEVVNGVSERGGYPVVKKKLRQWYLRITEYAGRLQADLDKLEWTDAMKEMQTNWIGKSYGAEIEFKASPTPPKEGLPNAQTLPAKELTTNPTTLNSEATQFGLSPSFGGVGEAASLTVYTTRPDTIMGVDFMVVAPELEWINDIKSPEQATAVDEYIAYVNSRSERERQAEKKITGCFTGAYAINPFNGQEIPIWISEYVLAGYGTGAIMAVPCGDDRDFKFARHFNIPITNIIGDAYNGEEANPTKDAVLSNSGFLDGLPMRKAMEVVLEELEKRGIGRRKTNYRMRDAAFSRQRYWGEPFPIVWKDGIAYPLPENELPLELPYMENIKPGSNGEGPLANNLEWSTAPIPAREPELEGLESGDKELGIRETNTMPGYAGSSWYFLRYMDPHNTETFADRTVTDYWNQVDVYIGGTEHAVGHLLYSRMWTKALFDLGHIGFDEPFKKLVNQGMITGVSEKVVKKLKASKVLKMYGFAKQFYVHSYGELHYREGNYNIPPSINLSEWSDIYYSAELLTYPSTSDGKEETNESLIEETNEILIEEEETGEIHVDINVVKNNVLNIEKYVESPRIERAEVFVCKRGWYNSATKEWRDFERNLIAPQPFLTIPVVEKMSKSKLNVVNPDEIVHKYGADTFRMYEMFLGPIEQSKPWDTKGIEGVHRFLKKLWRLFFDEVKDPIWTDETPTAAELKILHRTIKKIEDDTERFSFNTAVSAFMVCVNELGDIKCYKKAILEPLLIMLTPYAPHIAEELYQQLQTGSNVEKYQSVLDATFPAFEEKYIVESTKEYPVSINGKLRTTLTFPLDAEQSFIEKEVMANEVVLKWTEGKEPRKIIYVRGRMINVVV